MPIAVILSLATGLLNMNDGFVPRSVINRLPRYLQALNLMAKAGLHTVSSEFLAEQVGTNWRCRE